MLVMGFQKQIWVGGWVDGVFNFPKPPSHMPSYTNVVPVFNLELNTCISHCLCV